MIMEEKIQQILDDLIEGTKSGYIKWKSTINFTFNSNTRYKMKYINDDNTTTFTLDVWLTDDMLGPDSVNKDLYIYNDSFASGSLQVSGYDYNVDKLHQLVYEKFVKPLVKPNINSMDNLLDSISSTISKQYIREKNIDNILDTDIDNDNDKL